MHSVSQSVSNEEVNVTKFKIKIRSFLLAPVPTIVPAVYWKIPAKKCTEPGPIFIKYGQTSITNGAQLTFLAPSPKAIGTRVCGATFTELCVNSARSAGKMHGKAKRTSRLSLFTRYISEITQRVLMIS
jgi:hypothetical protein